jgi:hypothetical protein
MVHEVEAISNSVTILTPNTPNLVRFPITSKHRPINPKMKVEEIENG